MKVKGLVLHTHTHTHSITLQQYNWQTETILHRIRVL